MKKVLLFIAVGAFAVSLSSCAKDYECTYEGTAGISGTTTITTTTTCSKCSKDDVAELEDAGWECE